MSRNVLEMLDAAGIDVHVENVPTRFETPELLHKARDQEIKFREELSSRSLIYPGENSGYQNFFIKVVLTSEFNT
ncbi:MAG: hypothetical protein WDO06_05535 [Actinomycetota bacterium]